MHEPAKGGSPMHEPDVALRPVVLLSDAVYDDGEVRLLLGVTERALRTARARDGLRSTRLGRRRLYRGAWLLAWLESTGDVRGSESGRPTAP